jgi:AcrR family transcriptional regulator
MRATQERQKRPYRMKARAAAAEQTAQRIYAAAVELFRSHPFPEVTLQAVAERAGVTLQTVLRRFGSKEMLFEAAGNHFRDRVMQSRVPARPADIRSAIESLVASYEEMGDLNWHALCQEDQSAVVRAALDKGRAAHRRWLETSFAHLLPARAGAERERRVLLLFGVTDFYLWKLFRRDLGHERQATTKRMIDLVAALARAFTREGSAP